MSSYTTITVYRSRTGALMAYAEDSSGRGKPVKLTPDALRFLDGLSESVDFEIPEPNEEQRTHSEVSSAVDELRALEGCRATEAAE